MSQSDGHGDLRLDIPVLPHYHGGMIISRMTAKYQATVPAAVRRVLDLHKGDAVIFEVEGDRVLLRKALPMDIEYLRSLQTTLCEWTSDHDAEAYRDL